MRLSNDDVLSGSEVICRQIGSCSKSDPEFLCFGLQILKVRVPKFRTQFINLYSLPNMWQSLVAIGQGISEITRRKEEINISSKT